jgi:hypothetical protein
MDASRRSDGSQLPETGALCRAVNCENADILGAQKNRAAAAWISLLKYVDDVITGEQLAVSDPDISFSNIPMGMNVRDADAELYRVGNLVLLMPPTVRAVSQAGALSRSKMTNWQIAVTDTGRVCLRLPGSIFKAFQGRLAYSVRFGIVPRCADGVADLDRTQMRGAPLSSTCRNRPDLTIQRRITMP